MIYDQTPDFVILPNIKAEQIPLLSNKNCNLKCTTCQMTHAFSCQTATCLSRSVVSPSFLKIPSCHAATLFYSFVPCVLKNVPVLWCWKGLSPSHDLRSQRSADVVFLETRCIHHAAHFVLSENNSCKVDMVPKTNMSLLKVCSDYLQQELELGDPFGQRSGRG